MGTGGITRYPEQSCTGTLKRIGVSGAYSFFAEEITQGRYDAATNAGCFDGTVTLNETGGKLHYGWFGVTSGETVIAGAVLTKDGATSAGTPVAAATVDAPPTAAAPPTPPAAPARAPQAPAATPAGRGNAATGNAAATGAVAPAPLAAGGGAKLQPDEIQLIFGPGSPIAALDPAGRKSTLVFRGDGTASASPASGPALTGTWRFSADGYCSKWSGAGERCFTVRRAAAGFDVLDADNRLIAHWE